MVGKQDAGDVTQQVFLQAFCSLGKFAGRSSFETWLYRLAVNESLQHLRRARRHHLFSLAFEPIDNSHVRDGSEPKELLDVALARLDPQLRSVFLLCEIDKLSYRQIAETLEVPEGTVGSRLNRARRELRTILTDLGWQP
jgi:RNA polymerase sigma-70 factor (ECF subfamily)